ncbi:MAG: hypothetical protein JSS81_22080 [Acidobacteria bacterium]|nr:hypothetical protein [Acidobacteriota bacterium]
MKNRATQINKKTHTRIRVSSTERLIVWQKPQDESNIVLKCPHCGMDVFWLETSLTECQVQQDQYEYESED